MRVYLDPAVLLRRIARGPRYSDVRQQLHESWWVGDLIATSQLARLELERFALRANVSPEIVLESLVGIDLVPLDRAVLDLAVQVGGRDLDLVAALHVASALRIEADVAICYDDELSEALQAEGIEIRRP